MVATEAFAQCESLMPGTAPAVYKITFSTGRVVRVKQPQPTPAGASPCLWSSLQSDGAYAVWHSNTLLASPFGGITLLAGVRLGIPDGEGISWKANYAPAPRDGAGPYTFDIGGGVTATVTPGP